MQRPGVALHTSHPPLHPLLQQKLSMHLPPAHCVSVAQLWPLSRRQAPDGEQVLAPVQVSASFALVNVVQVPGDAAQVWQVPAHAVLQQYPSLQVSVPPHSRHPETLQSPPVAVLQAAPPEWRSWHCPLESQKCVVAQSPSSAQAVGHSPAAPSHRYGPHPLPVVPLASKVHVPGVAPQTSHPPLQGVSQQ